MILLNGFQATQTRITIPWRGVWQADLELSPPPEIPTIPLIGPAVLTIGTTAFTGVFDSNASGTFANKIHARIIGGRGGWGKTVPAQHFANPSGTLLSSLVYAATAALVLETVADTIPVLFGENYARTSGPASSIFGPPFDRDWHVDPITGTTIVGIPWIPLPLDPNATIIDADIEDQLFTIQSDIPILPGTILATDTRLNGQTYTVREVEHRFSSSEPGRALVWCSPNSVARLSDTFQNAVRASVDYKHLRLARYRFVLPASGTDLILQAITPDAPDLNPIHQWSGLQGCTSRILPGTEIVVGFAGGPNYPVTLAFSPLTVPLEVDLAGGATPLVPTPWAVAFQVALAAFLGSPPLTAANLPAKAAAFLAALPFLPPSATILTKAT